MKRTLKVGDEAIIRYTGEIVTIRVIVKAAYNCYYYYNSEGEPSDGYFVEDDLIKLKG